MYEQLKNTEVLNELNDGSEMYVVDIPTQRVMSCDSMTLGAILSFMDKPEAMFFKAVANE